MGGRRLGSLQPHLRGWISNPGGQVHHRQGRKESCGEKLFITAAKSILSFLLKIILQLAKEQNEMPEILL